MCRLEALEKTMTDGKLNLVLCTNSPVPEALLGFIAVTVKVVVRKGTASAIRTVCHALKCVYAETIAKIFRAIMTDLWKQSLNRSLHSV